MRSAYSIAQSLASCLMKTREYLAAFNANNTNELIASADELLREFAAWESPAAQRDPLDIVRAALDAYAGGDSSDLPDNTRLRVCFGPNMVLDGWPVFGNDPGMYCISGRRYSDIWRKDMDCETWFHCSRVIHAEAYKG